MVSTTVRCRVCSSGKSPRKLGRCLDLVFHQGLLWKGVNGQEIRKYIGIFFHYGGLRIFSEIKCYPDLKKKPVTFFEAGDIKILRG